jgi:hypothetical protein
MLFEGGVASSPQLQKTQIKMNQTVETILEQADIYGLRSEVRATAMAIVRENPSLPTGSAYMMAAQEWDVL